MPCLFPDIAKMGAMSQLGGLSKDIFLWTPGTFLTPHLMLRQDRMIIDSHCHCGKGDGLTGPWDTDAPLDDYLRRATAAGITHTVLFSAFHSDYRAANRQVARIV